MISENMENNHVSCEQHTVAGGVVELHYTDIQVYKNGNLEGFRLSTFIVP